MLLPLCPLLLMLISSGRSTFWYEKISVTESPEDLQNEGMIMYNEFIELADKTQEDFLKLINAIDERSVVSMTENEEVIFAVDEEFKGKTYVVDFFLPIQADVLFKHFWFAEEDSNKWHPNAMGFEIVSEIDDDVRIIHQTVKYSNGSVYFRDFVDLMSYTCENGLYFITSQSIDYPDIPVPSGYSRGWNGLSGVSIIPSPNLVIDPKNETEFNDRDDKIGSIVTWVLNSNPKIEELDLDLWNPVEILLDMYRSSVKDLPVVEDHEAYKKSCKFCKYPEKKLEL